MSWLDLLRPGRSLVRVAPAGPGHCERLAEIHASAFARPWDAGEFELFLTDPAVLVDGVFLGRDRLPSGFVVSRAVADEAEILSLALARSARGRGRARMLLAQHLQTLAHAGIATVHLEVEEGNEPALALYRVSGFRPSGRRPGYYARPDGTRAAALSMTASLAGTGR